MSSIVISGDTSGAITIAAPAVAGTNTLTLPANTGTLITTASAGAIVQVVQGTYSTSTSTTSSSFSDTGLSASITPKSSTNKILVMVTINNYLARSGSDCAGAIQLLRGASIVWAQGSSGASNGPGLYLYAAGCSTTNLGVIQNINYLDSPATTSSTTYKVQQACFSGTMYSQYASTPSTITLIEIVA